MCELENLLVGIVGGSQIFVWHTLKAILARSTNSLTRFLLTFDVQKGEGQANDKEYLPRAFLRRY